MSVVANFDRALPLILIHEGGWVNHPKDPGGVTLEGITQRTYDAWRQQAGKLPRSLTTAQRKPEEWKRERDAIYREQYWNAIRGDELPPGVAYAVFDGAVNSGPRQAVKWLQRALQPHYAGVIDGVVGVQTLQALAEHPNHDALIRDMLARRMRFLKALRTFETFGKGWTARVRQVEARAQTWAMGDTGPAITWVPGGDAKASIEDARRAPGTGMADGATGGGIATTGAGQAVDQAKDQLAPMAGTNGWIDTAIAALTIAGVVVVIGGILWRLYARHKARQLADDLDLEGAPA